MSHESHHEKDAKNVNLTASINEVPTSWHILLDINQPKSPKKSPLTAATSWVWS